MKFKLKITHDILKRSMMCGVETHKNIVRSCAFALAFNELVPNVYVAFSYTHFVGPNNDTLGSVDNTLGSVDNTLEQRMFIAQFDGLKNTPNLRLELPEQEFDVEIPDVVINYYFQDAVELAKALANTPVLQKL